MSRQKVKYHGHLSIDGLSGRGEICLTETDVELGSANQFSSGKTSIERVSRLAEIGLLVVQYVRAFEAESYRQSLDHKLEKT